MSPRDPRLQAAALRLAAERLDRGEALAPELADALANDMARHPEELAAIEAHEGPLPRWMADELDRRDRDDAGTEEDGEVVMARLLAKHATHRHIGRPPVRTSSLPQERPRRFASGSSRIWR